MTRERMRREVHAKAELAAEDFGAAASAVAALKESDGGRAGFGPWSTGVAGICRGTCAQPRDASSKVSSTRFIKL